MAELQQQCFLSIITDVPILNRGNEFFCFFHHLLTIWLIHFTRKRIIDLLSETEYTLNDNVTHECTLASA